MFLAPPNNPAVALGVGSYLITPRWFLGLPVVTTLSGNETVYSIQDGVDCQVPLALIPQQDAVTSVALAAPSIFTVSGSPILPGPPGTITLGLANEAQNSAFLGPSSGGAGTPTFRPITNADLPVIGIANGGTGQTTQAAALTALLGGVPLSIANGGTGQTTQSAALTALLGSSTVPIANGGTGSTTAAAAATALSFAPIVGSISALRSVAHTVNRQVWVSGYYTAGDGGGGFYWYNSADTTSSDNGGTIIVASDGGRWYLQYWETVSVHQFGARGDGVTDDTAAIQAAFTWAEQLGTTPTGGPMGKVTAFAGKQYITSATLDLVQPTTVDFQGAILYTPTVGSAVRIGKTLPINSQNRNYNLYFARLLSVNGNTSNPTKANNAFFQGSISGTTLTVSSVQLGALAIGQLVQGIGVAANTLITAGSGTSWTVSVSQTVSTVETMTAMGTNGIEVCNMQFSHLRVGDITQFTGGGFYANSTNVYYSGQQVQDNWIELGQVAFNGYGCYTQSVSAATGAFQVNEIHIQNIFGNFGNLQVDNGAGTPSTNASSSNTWFISAMDSAAPGGYAANYNSQYSKFELGYLSGTFTMSSTSAVTRLFAANNVATGAAVVDNCPDGSNRWCLGSNQTLPASVTFTSGTQVQNTYGVPVVVSGYAQLQPTTTVAQNVNILQGYNTGHLAVEQQINVGAMASPSPFTIPFSITVPAGQWYELVSSGSGITNFGTGVVKQASF